MVNNFYPPNVILHWLTEQPSHQGAWLTHIPLEHLTHPHRTVLASKHSDGMRVHSIWCLNYSWSIVLHNAHSSVGEKNIPAFCMHSDYDYDWWMPHSLYDTCYRLQFCFCNLWCLSFCGSKLARVCATVLMSMRHFLNYWFNVFIQG